MILHRKWVPMSSYSTHTIRHVASTPASLVPHRPSRRPHRLHISSYFSSSSSSSCRRRRRFRYPARVHSLSAPAAAGGRVGGAVRPAYFFFFFCPPPIKGARGRSRHAILDPCGYMLPCSSCARIARFSASTSAAVLRSILISSSGIR